MVESEQPEPGAGPPLRQASSSSPLIVQYLYVHQRGESFEYPSSRDRSGSPERLALRYLECVLVQAASLRLRDTPCELVLVTNAADRQELGRAGTQMMEQIEALGVDVVIAGYEHGPAVPTAMFAASRYVLDAITATVAGQDPERPLWLLDVDCVWIDPPRVLAALPPAGSVGCVHIPYPPDWSSGPGANREELGRLAQRMGAASGPPPAWVGGELLAGRACDLLALAQTCEALDRELAALEVDLATEEELLTLASALGRIRVQDMTHLVARIWTGPRHGAPPVEDPASLAVWHLPSEKGLGFRRTAREIGAGGEAQVRRDLEDPQRAMRRFNVAGAGRIRRARDDLWLLRQRAIDATRKRLAPPA